MYKQQLRTVRAHVAPCLDRAAAASPLFASSSLSRTQLMPASGKVDSRRRTSPLHGDCATALERPEVERMRSDWRRRNARATQEEERNRTQRLRTADEHKRTGAPDSFFISVRQHTHKHIAHIASNSCCSNAIRSRPQHRDESKSAQRRIEACQCV